MLQAFSSLARWDLDTSASFPCVCVCHGRQALQLQRTTLCSQQVVFVHGWAYSELLTEAQRHADYLRFPRSWRRLMQECIGLNRLLLLCIYIVHVRYTPLVYEIRFAPDNTKATGDLAASCRYLFQLARCSLSTHVGGENNKVTHSKRKPDQLRTATSVAQVASDRHGRVRGNIAAAVAGITISAAL